MAKHFELQLSKSGNQEQPGILALKNGTYLVLWHDVNRDADSVAIRGQIFTQKGLKLGSEFTLSGSSAVSTYTGLAALDDGGFVVAMMTANSIFDDKVSTQTAAIVKFNASGARVGGELSLQTREGVETSIANLATKSDGGFEAVWKEFDAATGKSSLYHRSFSDDMAATSSEIKVYETADKVDSVSVSALADGGSIVIWRYDSFSSGLVSDPDETGIYYQMLGANGAPVGQVQLVSLGIAETPSPVELKSGNILLVWSERDGERGWDVWGKLLSAQGAEIAQPFKMNSYTEADQFLSRAIALDDGGFLTIWTSYGQDGASGGIFGQKFNPDGSKNGIEFMINSSGAGDQRNPELASVDGTDYAVVWQSDELSFVDVVTDFIDDVADTINETFSSESWDQVFDGGDGVDTLSV